jgi:outer membrane protein OmpA-like peptidoglycan-associated protein
MVFQNSVYAQSGDFSLNDFYASGDTRIKGDNCYEITTATNWSAGGVWYKLPIDIKTSFEMQVELMLGCKDDLGADGIVFIFSPFNSITGRAGEGMGFAGLYPSLGIELDTWQNFHLADPAEDHIALMANGYVDHFSSLKGPIRIPNVEDCKLHLLTIQWIEINQTLNITLDGNPVLSYQGDILEEIFGNRNKIYWGVTAATGKFNNRHEICFKKLDFELALETLEFTPDRESKILEEKIISLENISFRSGSSAINTSSQVELFKLINLMRAYPTKSLDIFGHTDNVGNEHTNQKISYERAKAVSDFLIKHGISPDRLIVQGLGEWYPKSSNYSEEGRKLNRRIEIKFYQPRT